jgi:hypothetical protein
VQLVPHCAVMILPLMVISDSAYLPLGNSGPAGLSRLALERQALTV